MTSNTHETDLIQQKIALGRKYAAAHGHVYLVLRGSARRGHPIILCESGFLDTNDVGSEIVAVVTPSDARRAAG